MHLLSRQFSCSSLQSAAGLMDNAELLAQLPDDPNELAAFIQVPFPGCDSDAVVSGTDRVCNIHVDSRLDISPVSLELIVKGVVEYTAIQHIGGHKSILYMCMYIYIYICIVMFMFIFNLYITSRHIRLDSTID